MPTDNTETKRLRETVKWFALSGELFPKDGLVLAAVSGGPDSMTLLSMLHDLSVELEFRVAVAHFDHKLRESGDVERAMVEKALERFSGNMSKAARALGLSRAALYRRCEKFGLQPRTDGPSDA